MDAGCNAIVLRSVLAPQGPLAITTRGATSPGHLAGSDSAQRSAGLPATMIQPGTLVAAPGSAEQRKAGAKARGFARRPGIAQALTSTAAATGARTADQRSAGCLPLTMRDRIARVGRICTHAWI